MHAVTRNCQMLAVTKKQADAWQQAQEAEVLQQARTGGE